MEFNSQASDNFAKFFANKNMLKHTSPKAPFPIRLNISKSSRDSRNSFTRFAMGLTKTEKRQ